MKVSDFFARHASKYTGPDWVMPPCETMDELWESPHAVSPELLVWAVCQPGIIHEYVMHDFCGYCRKRAENIIVNATLNERVLSWVKRLNETGMWGQGEPCSSSSAWAIAWFKFPEDDKAGYFLRNWVMQQEVAKHAAWLRANTTPNWRASR
jgi:hypothetical protein